MTKLIGVYGAAGCGRGIIPLVRFSYPMVDVVFIDDGQAPGRINGHQIITWPDFLQLDSTHKSVSLAVADSKIRQNLADKCSAAGVSLIEVRAASVVQMDDVFIEEGACLSPFVTITSNIRIGRCFHANLYSYVEHDSIIGDFVTLGPGAKINGNVVISDHAYIGSGAIIRQGLKIGAGAVVGMGSVVTRDVAPGATVVGNPAKLLHKG